ncbi:matrix metalloproteinase-26-like [Trichosurus vulpecula]|uniref:matrix metalloproteinase-26-like n=1 Tax=Trichosurus vulpecula TaxID=9337 RepID=UPI00186B2DB5|nr:matrix metalloproteinase-26-like [Trichosurus vulpecula]
MLSTLLIFAFFLPCCLSLPVIPKDILDDSDFFKDYFHCFFFTEEESLYSTMEDQLRFLQHFFRLEETGWLDEPTKAIIRQPRCGVQDIADYSFFPGKPKIKNNPITYSVINYPRGMSPRTVERILRKAEEVWSSVTPLKFRRVHVKDSDIEFAFLYGDHGDGYTFDGKGEILANTFAPHPVYQGTIHFDNDEDWSNSEEGINLFLVAVHEIGHALAPRHSQDSDSIT